MNYDVVVIGGGTAGTAAAQEATNVGARVALVNDGALGGLCILRGCMPTKSMLASAHAAHEIERLMTDEQFSVTSPGAPIIDFPGVMRRKQQHVERFQKAKIESIESGGYEVIDGRAQFAAGALRVNGDTLTAKRFVIATGSTPFVPNFGDGVRVITSDDVMALDHQPESIVVVGSGAIGLELGQFFARMGTQVTLLSRSPLLSHLDPACGEALSAALQKEPRFDLFAPSSICRATPDGSGVAVEFDAAGERRTVRADLILAATGRHADLSSLNLPEIGIDPLSDGIEHESTMATSANPDVFVAGDATGRHKILHLASQEGRVAGFNAAGATPLRQMDYRLEMGAFFTDPPFGQVGLTHAAVEQEKKRGRKIISNTIDLSRTGRAITMGVAHGRWTLHVDQETCEIVGSAILGPRADELIHIISSMMYYRGSVQDIAEMPWYHPTVAEVIISHARAMAPHLPNCCIATAPPA